MPFLRKLVRVIVKAVIIFASTHLIILTIHAMISNEWDVLSMTSIMDIGYLYGNPNFSFAIEGGLWFLFILLLGFFWFIKKEV